MLLSLQIVSSGEYLVLNPNGALTIEVHTSFFNNQTDLFGTFSYPFQIPLEPNRAALKNAHYIPTAIGLRTFWVMVGLNGAPWKKCKFNYTRTGNIIEGTAVYDFGVIASQSKTLMLWQLTGAYPGVPDVESSQVNPDDMAAYMKSTTTAVPGTMPMVFFPWKNDGAYKPGSDFNGPTLFQGLFDAGTNTPELKNTGTDPGLRPVSALEGWYYKVSVSGTVDLGGGASLVLTVGDMVMLDGDSNWYKTANPYAVRADGFTDLAFPADKIINRWELDGLGNGSFILDKDLNYQSQTQTPFFYDWFIIKRIFGWFGVYTITGSLMTDENFLRMCIWSRVALDDTGLINDVSYYLPNSSVSEYIASLREYGVFVDWDMTRNVGMVESLANMQSKSPVVDLRPFQVAGSIRETKLTQTYYVLQQAVDQDDQAFPQDYTAPTLQIGSADPSITETDITISSVATNMVLEQEPTDPLLSNLSQDAILSWPTPIVANWRIPYIKQPIYRTSPFDPVVTVDFKDKNIFKLRRLYYHGMAANALGYTYPYGSSDNQSESGATLTSFTLGLQPGANDFSPLASYYSFLLKSKPFEMIFKLKVPAMLQLAANARYAVYDDDLRATVYCMLDQASADLQANKELIDSKITLYPIILEDNTTQPNGGIITPPPPPPFDNGVVYVRFLQETDPAYPEVIEEHPTEANSFFKDLNVYFFEDSAGTIPKSVTDLIVGYSNTETDFFATTTTSGPFFDYVTCNGTMFTLQPGAPMAENFTDGSGWSIVWTYAILGSAYYTIIP